MSQSPPPLLDRVLHGALLILGTVIMLWLALELLAHIWVWLLVLALVAAAVGFVFWRRRQDRW